jgi:hypothetical protein
MASNGQLDDIFGTDSLPQRFPALAFVQTFRVLRGRLRSRSPPLVESGDTGAISFPVDLPANRLRHCPPSGRRAPPQSNY